MRQSSPASPPRRRFSPRHSASKPRQAAGRSSRNACPDPIALYSSSRCRNPALQLSHLCPSHRRASRRDSWPRGGAARALPHAAGHRPGRPPRPDLAGFLLISRSCCVVLRDPYLARGGTAPPPIFFKLPGASQYVFSVVILRPRLRGRRILSFGRPRFFARSRSLKMTSLAWHAKHVPQHV